MSPSLEAMSREELRRLAKNRGVVMPAGTRKADLVAALRATSGQAGSAESADNDPRLGDLKPGAAPPSLHDIPWGYGETRVTAMARDPHWLYVYWEATDEIITDARAKLGPGGPTATTVLRVYDTTHRIFDGTNANTYFDVPIEREWRSHFLKVERPRSVFHIELGMKSHEGFFAAMARSGAAEMPADSVSADGTVEWMTVVPNQRPPQSQPYRHRYTPPPHHNSFSPAPMGGAGEPGSVQSQPGSNVALWQGDAGRALRSLFGVETSHGEWFEQIVGGRFVRWVTWQGERQQVSWRSGPIQIPWGHVGPVEIWFEGQHRVMLEDPHGAERLEFGPWHVLITGLGADGERRVLDTWMIHRTWGGRTVSERIESLMLYRRIFGAYGRRSLLTGASEILIREEAGASQELFAGASERLWVGASELLLGGASLVVALGASETWSLGASETLALGASETLWGGASLFAAIGASERQAAGASENILGGASLFGGASMLGGASKAALGGASEQIFQGGSESILGVSSGSNWQGFTLAPVVTGPLAGRGTPVTVSQVVARTTMPAGAAKGPHAVAVPAAKAAKVRPATTVVKATPAAAVAPALTAGPTPARKTKVKAEATPVAATPAAAPIKASAGKSAVTKATKKVAKKTVTKPRPRRS